MNEFRCPLCESILIPYTGELSEREGTGHCPNGHGRFSCTRSPSPDYPAASGYKSVKGPPEDKAVKATETRVKDSKN